MKKCFLAISLMLALCLGLTVPALAANTSGSCGTSARWSYNNGTLTIQGTGKMADYAPVFAVDVPWADYLEQIHTVNIENGITAIGDYAFSDCINLTSVTIPGSITAIGTGAFSSCESLTSVSIPSSVTTFGDFVFNCCTGLTNINVASGNPAYSSVDGVLFNANQTLLHTYPAGKSSVSYSIPASVTRIGDNAFYNCDSLSSVTIPSSVESIGDSAFAWCTSLTSATIPNGITTIEAWTFLRCSSLTGISIPNSVTSIGSNAFSCCENLASVTIPNSVAVIGEKAFYERTRLSSIIIPNSVKAFGSGAFQGCSSLTSVIIPNGVRSLPLGLFSLYSSLTSVTIPDSVTTIGIMAFNRCNSLKDIYYGGNENQWAQITISRNGNSLTNAAIHYNSTMPTTPAELEPPVISAFADVPVGEWYTDAVAWAIEKEITTGTGNNKFSPDQDCTNAQILTFIWRAYGKPEPTIDNPFTNSIPDGYKKAAVWAHEKGMVSGTTFDTDKPCTRAMAMTYLWQAAGSPTAPAASFTDIPAGAAYAQAVAWAVEQKITTGMGNGTTFSPDDVCNRGQIVTFLYRNLV